MVYKPDAASELLPLAERTGCFALTGAEDPCPECGYCEADPGEVTLYLAPRTLLAGKYLIGRVLGQGGFGITYLGWDTTLDVKLAIKEFFPQGLVSRVPGQGKIASYSGGAREELNYGIDRFLSEAKMLARFEHHPNIVSVRDFFKANNTAYMVMSYVEGFTLEHYLAREGGKIPYHKAIDIVMPVMDALREVHAVGIMHRDISPDNIFIDNRGRVVLLDFGAARQDLRDKSRSVSVILKAGYAPEEQYRSRGRQGPWTDVYAVGATIYRCITGRVPPESLDRMAEDDLVPPSQLGVDISAGLEQTLLKALAVKAEDRFHTVTEFQAELLEAGKQTGSNIWANKKTLLYAGAIVAFVLLILTVSISLVFYAPAALLQPPPSDKLVTTTEEADPAIDPSVSVALAADYYIDYTGGAIPLGDLPIGARVVDPSWEWEFRQGANYSNIDYNGNPTPPGEVKPVTWVVVAHNHYDLEEPHVTLLTEELIGLFAFDDSANRNHQDQHYGHNHWDKSGTTNATRGLRPWLNSGGIHSGEGFYHAFSDHFKSAVLTTEVPNREWFNGDAYITTDHVFIPTTTELGDLDHDWTYRIGTAFPLFVEATDDRRVALLGGHRMHYWLRSPFSDFGYSVRNVSTSGELYHYGFRFNYANFGGNGVRPALNLKSKTLVSEIRN